jgi:PmbA protein
VPVVFDPQMAARLISQFVGAAAGNAIYQKRSFLVGKLGQQVADSKVTIIDDGLMPGGLGSKPFDGEGLPTSKRTIIDRGSLTMYLMGSYSARKLGAEPNGGSLSNLYLEAGNVSPEDIIGSVKNGLYLTSVSGPGFNAVSGDYSMGASGIWIEDGKLAYPVEEITVASNILAMFANIEMVGNDLEFHSSVNAPTIKIARMMVAGE